MVKGENGTMGRGLHRRAAQKSALVEKLGHDGGQQPRSRRPEPRGGRRENRQPHRIRLSLLEVAHGGRGCNPGPRAWSARRGRAVACARGGVACGCAATTYRDLRPGGYCASGACSTRRVASIALVVVCGRRPYFARRRRHVRQQDSPRVFPDPHAIEGAARCIHVLGVSVTRGRRLRRRRRGWLVCAAE